MTSDISSLSVDGMEEFLLDKSIPATIVSIFVGKLTNLVQVAETKAKVC